ncbi:hypothetical protein [Nocardia arthritidis]|uniref:hypothetical protein n=1 Tax=Nocardia arthritidis TaxID=228602 RepID=UPI000AFE9429|nr:hypothetical protein [Nocardia arthritidis]
MRSVWSERIPARLHWLTTIGDVTRSRMYVEEFPAQGPLTAEIAQELAWIPGVYRSAITVSGNGRSVHAPVLPVAWDVLRIDSGTMVTVTAANGLGDEDRLAIRRFVERFQSLTGAASSPPQGGLAHRHR